MIRKGDGNINSGKEFENQIRDSMPKNVYYFRLKDPAQSFGKDSSKTRFSLTNPFDFFMYSFPYLYALENKSTNTTSLSWTLDKKIKGKNIKANQILELFEAYKKGLIAGFLINFSKTNETYFLHIKDFMELISISDKHSINQKDIEKHNGFLIKQELKKVKYNYDIDSLIKFCESNYEKYKFKGEENDKNKKV